MEATGTRADVLRPPTPVITPSRRRDSARRSIGYLLLGCWMVLSVAALLDGHRASTFEDLRVDVAAGRVNEVQVTDGLPAGSSGFSVVQLSWRDGLFAKDATVVEARPRDAEARRAAKDSDATAVLAQPVDESLAELDPDVRLIRVVRSDGLQATSSVLGVRTTSWVSAALIAALVATLLLVANTPEPRRATRWGWFWLVLLYPVGPLAYLALSGALASGTPAPSGRRRLTGGWALLLVLVVGNVLGTNA